MDPRPTGRIAIPVRCCSVPVGAGLLVRSVFRAQNCGQNMASFPAGKTVIPNSWVSPLWPRNCGQILASKSGPRNGPRFWFGIWSGKAVRPDRLCRNHSCTVGVHPYPCAGTTLFGSPQRDFVASSLTRALRVLCVGLYIWRGLLLHFRLCACAIPELSSEQKRMGRGFLF